MDKKTDLYGENLSLVEGSPSQPSQLINASVCMRKKFHPFPSPEPPGLICNDHVTTRNSARPCLVLTELVLLCESNCVKKSWPGLAGNVTLPGQKGDPAWWVTLLVELTFCLSCKRFAAFSKETYKQMARPW